MDYVDKAWRNPGAEYHKAVIHISKAPVLKTYVCPTRQSSCYIVVYSCFAHFHMPYCYYCLIL